MTGNQIFALSMPLITAAVVGLTGLFIRKPWNEKKRQPEAATATAPPERITREAINHASDILRKAQRELQTHL